MVSFIWPICQTSFLKKRIRVSNAKELTITSTFILFIWKVLEFSNLSVPSLQIIFYLQLNWLLKYVNSLKSFLLTLSLRFNKFPLMSLYMKGRM